MTTEFGIVIEGGKEVAYEPTISPAELIQQLRKSEGPPIQIGYPRKGRKPIYYGSLDGEVYYQLLFEISTIPAIETAMRLQNLYHSLPRGGAIVAAMRFKMPDDLNVLAETLSVSECEDVQMKDLLYRIGQMSGEEKPVLLRALMTFDQQMKDQFEKDEKPAVDTPTRLPITDLELIADLVGVNRMKWDKIWERRF